MKKHSIELTALDTLFFKDGKPFSMGEESWAKGIFPPYPSAIYGMLRSIWFADHMDELSKANVVGGDPSLDLRLLGYLMTLNGEPAFPIPADLYGGSHKGIATRFALHQAPSEIRSEYTLPAILTAETNGKYEDLNGKALLKRSVFQDYLLARGSCYAYETFADYTTQEPKIGIGKDRFTRTSADGQLYRLAMHRLEKRMDCGQENRLSFLLQSEGLTLPDQGLTRVGAETRSASYCQRDFPSLHNPVTADALEFKIYLATPAVLEEGAYPTKWFAQYGLSLLAAAIGKPEHIGGFDMQAGKPKPMYKAVPSGTVYYVQAQSSDHAAQLSRLHGGSIYDLASAGDSSASYYRNQGFGHTYLGLIHSPQ